MMAFADLVDHMQAATWWPFASDKEIDRNLGRRTLQGEINLETNLCPTSALGLYKVFVRCSQFASTSDGLTLRLQYDVALFDVKAVGFTPKHGKSDKPWLAVPVEIATIWADGPRPISYSPQNNQDTSS